MRRFCMLAVLIVLTAICLACFIGCSPAAKVPSDGLEFEAVEGGYAVVGYSGSDLHVVIPDTHEGKPVVAIGEEAFRDHDTLTNVTIPDGVTTIDSFAFHGCTSLVSIELPNSLTTVGGFAFFDCTSLLSIRLGKGVTTIEGFAFADCVALKSIKIPKGVSKIEEGAFSGCAELMHISVAWGNEAYHVKGNCLIDTERKTLIKGCANSRIPKDGSVTRIGRNSFSGTKGLSDISFPDSITEIGFAAFNVCPDLREVVIPNSVTDIEGVAFSGCASLTAVSVGRNVASIGSGAFGGCSALAEFKLAPENTFYHMAGNCLIETASKKLMLGYGNCVIPDGGSVTEIESYAFSGCKGITSLVIPDSVTEIGIYAFAWCDRLTSLTVGAGVVHMDICVAYECTALREVIFVQPEGWRITLWKDEEPVDVTDPARAAEYLRDMYHSRDWYRQ